MVGGGLVKGPDAGDQPGDIVLAVAAECHRDLLRYVIDGVVDDRHPEGLLGPEPVVDEGVPHAEACVELPYRDCFVAQLGKRLQPALKDLLRRGHRRARRRPAGPTPRLRHRHDTSLIILAVPPVS